jgi:hypothetical protein
MNLVNGHNKLCKEICDALGLRHVKQLDLHMSTNEIMTITVEMYPEVNGVMQLPSIFKKFNLVEKK